MRQETTCTFLGYLVSVYLDISAAVPSPVTPPRQLKYARSNTVSSDAEGTVFTQYSTFEMIYLARHTIKHRQLSMSGLGPWIWFHSFSVPLKHRADIIKFDPSLVRCLRSDNIIASYVVSIELQWVGQLSSFVIARLFQFQVTGAEHWNSQQWTLWTSNHCPAIASLRLRFWCCLPSVSLVAGGRARDAITQFRL